MKGPDRPAGLGGYRFMLYSHDGFGLGHFRRNLIIAETLVERCPRASVLMACAAEGLDTFSLRQGIDLLRLPGLRKLANGTYGGRRLPLGTSEIADLRSALLTAAVANFRPHVLVVDKHPLGLGDELREALVMQRRVNGRAAFGLRDVLDDPRATGREWHEGNFAHHVAELYQRVLVYGSPDFLNPLSEGLLAGDAARAVRFCGYVVPPATADAVQTDLPRRTGRPLVLATVGGGEDGAPILDLFLAASAGADWQGIVVAGPQMSQTDWHGLESRAQRAGVSAYRAVPNVARWYRHADAALTMGGYNSLLEAVTSGTPTVVVPRVRPRLEQMIRARAFADRGLLTLVGPDPVTAPMLAAGIRAALATDRSQLRGRISATLDLGGAQRAAGEIAALAAEVDYSDRHWATKDADQDRDRAVELASARA